MNRNYPFDILKTGLKLRSTMQFNVSSSDLKLFPSDINESSSVAMESNFTNQINTEQDSNWMISSSFDSFETSPEPTSFFSESIPNCATKYNYEHTDQWSTSTFSDPLLNNNFYENDSSFESETCRQEQQWYDESAKQNYPSPTIDEQSYKRVYFTEHQNDNLNNQQHYELTNSSFFQNLNDVQLHNSTKEQHNSPKSNEVKQLSCNEASYVLQDLASYDLDIESHADTNKEVGIGSLAFESNGAVLDDMDLTELDNACMEQMEKQYYKEALLEVQSACSVLHISPG